MGSVSPHTSSRTAYLRRCVRISLLKRWPWLLLFALLGALAGWSWHGLRSAAVLGLAGLLLSALSIALSSWRRHAADLPSPY